MTKEAGVLTHPYPNRSRLKGQSAKATRNNERLQCSLYLSNMAAITRPIFIIEYHCISPPILQPSLFKCMTSKKSFFVIDLEYLISKLRLIYDQKGERDPKSSV